MSAAYDGRQFVGIDLHRRRSVICRTDQDGEVLEVVRISNDPHMLAQVMGPAQLASWVGLTPRHHQSDTHVHRGPITKQAPGCTGWAAIEAVQRVGPADPAGRSPGTRRRTPRPQHRRGRRRP